MESGLLTHCGSQRCSMQQLLTIPEPEKTNSYTPLNHYDLAFNTQKIATDLLTGFSFAGDNYALSTDGQKMFGVITYHKQDENDLKVAIGIRNSYDRSMSAGLVVGSAVLVCDNLMFAGDVKVMRKHQGPTMHEDLQDQIVMAIYKSQHQFTKLSEDARHMRDIPLSRMEKYEYLGVLTGEGVLSPTQSTKAFKEVLEPAHEEFKSGSLWAAYNCATEALKSSPVQEIIKRHQQLHHLTRTLFLN